jgi:YVTN family beta-propeller protein
MWFSRRPLSTCAQRPIKPESWGSEEKAAKMIKHWFAPLIVQAALATVVGAWSYGQGPVSSRGLATHQRRPVALAFVDSGRTLLVANRQSGSLTLIDTVSRRVIAESNVGQRLSDVAALPADRQLLVLDQAADQVILIACRDRSITVVDRLNVSPDPIKLVVLPGGSSCIVASLWSRRLSVVAVRGQSAETGRATLSIDSTIDLPFCPRELALVADGHKLVVADAFGGRIAVVDLARRTIESVRSLPAHNIRGLALSPDGKTLVLAHQVLNRLAHTSFDDVHWGMVVRNHLRVLRVDAILKSGPDASLLDGGRLFDLGDVGYAAGDPGDLAFDAHGNLIVALAGVDEVGITASPDQGPRRVVVGRRPTALAPSLDGSVVYVADSLDDTVSVVATATGQHLATIALGPQRELTAPERGESLFYSAKLSHDGWMSCHSCHTDGHTNNLASDTLGDGCYGAPKRVPSLFGVAATGPWTWTGSIARLEDQVKKSIMTTMQGPKPSDRQISDLTAYLKSLVPPADAKAGSAPDTAAATRGRAVFDAHKCASCHIPPDYTSAERFDVGLTDEVGNREFNPPALRAVNRRDALLHDGRARSIEDVFRNEHHPRGLKLSAREIDDLAAFLKTL